MIAVNKFQSVILYINYDNLTLSSLPFQNVWSHDLGVVVVYHTFYIDNCQTGKTQTHLIKVNAMMILVKFAEVLTIDQSAIVGQIDSLLITYGHIDQ